MSSVNGTSSVNNAQAGRYQSNISVENRGGKIHLSATGGNDRIKVSNMPNGMVSVRVNNQQLTFTREQAKRLVIHGGAGNDAIVLDKNLPRGLQVDGGRGNDAIVNFSDGVRLKGGRGNDCIVNFGRFDSMDGGRGNDMLVQFGDHGTMKGGRGRDFMVAVGKGNDIYGERRRDFVADPLGRNDYHASRTGRHHHHRTHRRHHRHHHARPVSMEQAAGNAIRDLMVDSKIEEARNDWYQHFFPENDDR